MSRRALKGRQRDLGGIAIRSMPEAEWRSSSYHHSLLAKGWEPLLGDAWWRKESVGVQEWMTGSVVRPFFGSGRHFIVEKNWYPVLTYLCIYWHTCFCSAEAWTQGLVWARHALYHWITAGLNHGWFHRLLSRFILDWTHSTQVARISECPLLLLSSFELSPHGHCGLATLQC